MREITLEELLAAGCHFGHQVTRQNPKARDFVYEARDGIHIIDLAKTKQGLEEAAAFIRDLARKPESTLVVVGTKRQAQPVVEAQVKKVQEEKVGDGLFFVTNRWIGGLLTNFSEVSKNFKKLEDLAAKLSDEEEKSKYTKKEVGQWGKEKTKLESFYGGVNTLKKVPDALFIIDSHTEDLAVREAKVMSVKTVAIVDTNADPHLIDYPIAANDDALGSIELITSYIIDAWIEGRKDAELRVKNEELRIKKEEKKAKVSETKEKPKAASKKEKDGKSRSSKTKKAA